jgi:hypothetical protein
MTHASPPARNPGRVSQILTAVQATTATHTALAPWFPPVSLRTASAPKIHVAQGSPATMGCAQNTASNSVPVQETQIVVKTTSATRTCNAPPSHHSPNSPVAIHTLTVLESVTRVAGAFRFKASAYAVMLLTTHIVRTYAAKINTHTKESSTPP